MRLFLNLTPDQFKELHTAIEQYIQNTEELIGDTLPEDYVNPLFPLMEEFDKIVASLADAPKIGYA